MTENITHAEFIKLLKDDKFKEMAQKELEKH